MINFTVKRGLAPMGWMPEGANEDSKNIPERLIFKSSIN
jgi:hypothetical protein